MSSGASDASALAGASAAPIVATLRTDANAMALLHESNLGEISAGQRAEREASDSGVKRFAQQMVSEHTALDAQGMALGQRLNVTPALPDSQLPQLQQRELQALPGGGASGGASTMGTPPSANVSGSVTGGVGATGAGMPANPGTSTTTGASGSATGTPSTAGVGTGSGSSASGSTTGGVGATGVPAGSTTGPDSTVRSSSSAPAAMGGMSGMSGMSGAPSAFDRAYIAQQVTAHARTLALVDAAIARASNAELKTTLQSQVRPAVAQHLAMAQTLQARLGQ